MWHWYQWALFPKQKLLFKNEIKRVTPVSCYFYLGELFMSSLCCQFRPSSTFSSCFFSEPFNSFHYSDIVLTAAIFWPYFWRVPTFMYNWRSLHPRACITQVLTEVTHIALLIYKGGLSSFTLISSLIFCLLYTRQIWNFPIIFPLSIPEIS